MDGAPPASRASAGPVSERVWATALGLALGPAVALGLARFAYALLLPAMRTDLSWSFTQAGTINTANAVGYLIGALIAAPVITRVGGRQAFLGSLLLTALALTACAISSAFPVLLSLRLIAGAAGAVAFIVGASLATQLATGASPARAAVLLGVYFAGGGLGVAVSGLLIPLLLSATGTGGWRWGWLLLGALAFAATVAAVPAARRAPLPRRSSHQTVSAWRARPVAVTLGAYALFGAGYIAYVTFIIAFLKGQGAGTVELSGFWVTLGLAAIGSTFAWGPLLARLRGGRGIALATAVVTLGAAIPLLSGSIGGAFASAVLFGGSFLAVPTAVTAFARRTHNPHHWTIAIAALTVAFAVGQCLGPVLAGVLSDGPGGVRAGLTLSVLILAAGALLAVVQHQPDPTPVTGWHPHPAPVKRQPGV